MNLFLILLFANTLVGDLQLSFEQKDYDWTYAELIGTWRSIQWERDKYGPKFEIIINRDSIFLSKTHIGSGGYKQLLEYVISKDTVHAVEDEIMFFDQNIGYISGHYKFRNKMVNLFQSENKHGKILVLFPMQPGGVLSKVTNDSIINYNFSEQFARWRIGNDFKCDYKENGRPKTSTTRRRD
jgi:hypothetical protein